MAHDATHLYFLTKARQASWAEYILLRAGIAMCNAAINPHNRLYAAQYPPGSLPTPWDEKNTHSNRSQLRLTMPASDTTRQEASLLRRFAQAIDTLMDEKPWQ